LHWCAKFELELHIIIGWKTCQQLNWVHPMSHFFECTDDLWVRSTALPWRCHGFALGGSHYRYFRKAVEGCSAGLLSAATPGGKSIKSSYNKHVYTHNGSHDYLDVSIITFYHLTSFSSEILYETWRKGPFSSCRAKYGFLRSVETKNWAKIHKHDPK